MSYIPTDTLRRAARAYGSATFTRVPLLWSRCTGNQGTVTGKGGTTRLAFLATEACSNLQFVLENYTNAGAGEIATGNPITVIPVFEYPAYVFYDIALPVTPTFITAGGQAAYTIPNWGRLRSETLGLTLPAGAQPWVRVHVMLSLPPLSPAGATSTTGGTLAAAAYSYTITQVAGPQGESGPGTAVALTTTGTTSSNTLTWSFDPLSVPNTAVNVYRGNLLLATLPANTTSWTDTGALAVGTQAAPAAQKIPVGAAQTQTAYLTNQGNNLQNYGGTGANATRVSSFSGTFTSLSYAYGPSCVLATPESGGNKPVCLIIGDSIADGQNSIWDLGYIGQALLAAGIPWYQVSRPGEYTAGFLGGSARMRMAYAEACSDAVDEYGVNDSWNGITLAAMQANCITTWREARRRGVLRIHRATLSPRVVTTDNCATLANQTPGNGGTTEAVRTGFNSWVLDGCPYNPVTWAAQPVGTAAGPTCVRAPLYATGGTVLVAAGSGTHLLASVFNPWSAIEVNPAGVPTVNGGCWPVNGTAGYASEGTHPTNAMTALAMQQIPTALMGAPL